MSPAGEFSIVVVISYLAGSLPFGLLVAKLVRGIDIRAEGSGNIGATNTGRIIGAKWGIVVLLLDALKGLLPVLLLPTLFWKAGDISYLHAATLCGVSTVIGHMFSVWLKFKGGKGVATALGVLAVLSPYGVLVAIATFIVVCVLFRIVSLGSILAATAFALFHMWQLKSGTSSIELLIFVIPILIIIRHHSNIARLLQGKEPCFQSASKKTTDETSPDV